MNCPRNLRHIPALVVLSIGCSLASADQGLHFFEQEVRPLLVEHCYSCHSASEKIKGGLSLDSRSGWQNGGDSGPSIVAGNPEASLLLKAVRYAEKDLQMPPKEKLPSTKIEILRKWIAMGAPDPREQAASSEEVSTAIAANDLWSFQALKKTEPPAIQLAAWSTNAIDRYVLSRLKAAGLPPAKPAKRQLLLRRLHLDLAGLPPMPEELSANARIEAVVDKLLASDSFGDRWARHWLDLTAYADTMGIGRAIPAIEAWRYRDYVINAFNTDKPFDEFIRQQVSGDIKIPAAPGISEGPDPTAEDIIATGFLAIGPWELVGGDKPQLRMDIVDRQLNRMGKAFLGMTFECARCHDHKFDPVSQHDYYALAGIFKSTVTLNGRINGVFSDINKTQLPETADELIARAERIKQHNASVAAAHSARKVALKQMEELKKQIDATQKRLAETVTGEDKTALEKSLVEFEEKHADASRKSARQRELAAALKHIRHSRTKSLAYAVRDTPEPEDAQINIRGSAHQLGPVVRRGFPHNIAPTDKPAFTRGSSGRIQLAHWLADNRNPLTARVWVNRVWHHLFGAGLVRTVDNFGAKGEQPSHPELLDHLAAEFMTNGWSTKKLVRQIVLSKTWQQASINPSALEAGVKDFDPDNRLLWRANRRRLEAEAIRDSMLFVSGQLDTGRGGPSLPYEEPGAFRAGGTGQFPDNARMAESIKNRRTIYLPQKRKGPFSAIDFINAFDLPDNNHETGRRTVTAVPTQALYLANSKFIQSCADALYKRFADHSAGRRINEIYLHTLGRRPHTDEIKQAIDFIEGLRQSLGSEEKAWSRFCQSILMTNEFLFRS
ncbi:MAG: hypothetical protein CMO80_03060 [Verrucomicrobiales bacterium]|nr:hypothetical protein [Verrucomicrobiales bacterium]